MMDADATVPLINAILAICADGHWKENGKIHSKLADACVALICSFPSWVQGQIRTKLDGLTADPLHSAPVPSFRSAPLTVKYHDDILKDEERWTKNPKEFFGSIPLDVTRNIADPRSYQRLPAASDHPDNIGFIQKLEEDGIRDRANNFAGLETTLLRYISSTCASLKKLPQNASQDKFCSEFELEPSDTDGQSTTAVRRPSDLPLAGANPAAPLSWQEHSFMAGSAESSGESAVVPASAFHTVQPADGGAFSLSHRYPFDFQAPQTGMGVVSTKRAATWLIEECGPNHPAHLTDGNQQPLDVWQDHEIWGGTGQFRYPSQDNPYKRQCTGTTYASMSLTSVWD
ncbi:hypothetical protein CI238_13020 [Colletotrichum incanum]|uniref:Uncharacterized protein n=1 Tax=Colletotrichum incanum TaxID=1573173 RepID=A0A162PM52_COLIC|nr:hypothetical protein CI238_13020 [Colletotrichum incanum]